MTGSGDRMLPRCGAGVRRGALGWKLAAACRGSLGALFLAGGPDVGRRGREQAERLREAGSSWSRPSFCEQNKNTPGNHETTKKTAPSSLMNV